MDLMMDLDFSLYQKQFSTVSHLIHNAFFVCKKTEKEERKVKGAKINRLNSFFFDVVVSD
jgi:hypothetical protein